MGIDRVDHMLMVLGVSRLMKEEESEIVTRKMIRGFNDCASEAGTLVTGGQSIMNPWPIIGGVANTMCHESEYVRPNLGEPDDILILTKPIGTQVAVNLHQWYIEQNDLWTKSQQFVTVEECKSAYNLSIQSMSLLNKDTARLMKKYSCHGATDITGFGLLGHAQNLVNVQQKQPVDYIIHTLPIIDKMDVISSNVLNFRLLQGYSAETSGGILCMISPDKAADFVREHREVYGQDIWIIGEVIPAANPDGPKATIKDGATIINVKESFLHSV